MYLCTNFNTYDYGKVQNQITQEEVSELTSIIKKGCHTTQTYKGDLEAKIVQLCCSEPPKGFARWTLRMLSDKAVELGYIDKLSHVSVYNTLKKTNLSLGK